MFHCYAPETENAVICSRRETVSFFPHHNSVFMLLHSDCVDWHFPESSKIQIDGKPSWVLCPLSCEKFK